METYRIAPVFLQWAPCTTRYRRLAGPVVPFSLFLGSRFPSLKMTVTNQKKVCPDDNKVTGLLRISAGCLNQNQVVGWAMAQSRALCTNLRMVSCRQQNPLLDPIYRCSSNATKGAVYKGSIQGLCGRSVPPPNPQVIDELSALLLLDGWPESRLPNVSHGWYDVWPEACVHNSAGCRAHWALLENLGF